MNIAAQHEALLGRAAPARLTIPDLWDRARTFLAAMFATHGSPKTHLHHTFTARQRNAILRWLKPAERLARGLLIVSAITHLLMTEQGRRQRAAARPVTPPSPPRPPRRPFCVPTGIDLTASLARHYRREPPQPATEPPPPAQPAIDPDDPSTWRAPFRVLKWIGAGVTRKPPPRPASPSGAPASNQRLIRRIEALRRILEDPTARTRSLAAYIARLPKGCLGAAPPTVHHYGKPLPDLREDLFAMTDHVDTAIEAINSS